MKRYIVAMMVAAALIMSSAAFGRQVKSGGARVDRAVVQFTESVKLLDVMLKGEYLFVHDDEKMAQGLPCTYVYAHDKGKQGRLVASFHCIPVQKSDKAERFTVVVEWNAVANLPELVEYRFAGSNEGHKVPKQTE
ncbi:MAG TPA: hypothetical protein VNN73_01590 [Blastocatellia bacterium]|nr:hypothetical protein [Blastocatellia bacterium]